MPSVLLRRIDEWLLPDHSYLESTDGCYFLREYTAGGGFEASDTNNLVLNLKKDTKYRGQPPWKYKLKAIDQCATELRAALGKNLDGTVVVPIPPSKAIDHPDHDDRILKVATKLCQGTTATVRNMLRQATSTEALHLRKDSKRPPPHEIAENYEIDETLAKPVPARIWILDDLLTTGSHFKAMQMVLVRRFPAVKINGIFIARRRPNDDDDDEPVDEDE
jgi:predicted amidophosphoribosyltransferase